MSHFADRLTAVTRGKGTPLCVGLDPRWESLPNEIRERHGDTGLGAAAASHYRWPEAPVFVQALLARAPASLARS